jgi:MFS family permease
MVYARFDEAFSLARLKEGLSIRVGISAESLDVNQLYGSFINGNASKIYLDDNSNHLLVAWDQDFIRQARDWVVNTFPEVDQVNENFYVNSRALILFFQIFGGLGLFFMIIDPLSNLVFSHGKSEETSKMEQKDNRTKNFNPLIRMTLFSLALGVPGLILMMIMLLLLPMAIASFVISLLFGSVFGLIFFLYLYEQKRDKTLKSLLKKPLDISKETLIRHISLGIGLTFLLYVILYLSLGINYIGIIPSISKVLWIPFYFIPMFLTYYIYSFTFKTVAQNNFKNNLTGIFKSALLTFGIQYLYIIVYILGISFLSGSFFTLER